jgi:hypothetical protein
MYEQLSNKLGASQGISIVLHEDAGGRSDNQSHPPKKQNSSQKRETEKVRIYVASASPTNLLD